MRKLGRVGVYGVMNALHEKDFDTLDQLLKALEDATDKTNK
jgi:hypothetical protein